MTKEQLLAKLQQQNWTSHNVGLTETYSTLGNSRPLISEDGRTQIIRQNLALFQPDQDRSQQRLLDLGCLEGGLTTEMAKLGFQCLGIEGQTSNYEKCRLLKDYLQWPQLDFLLLDVKQLNADAQGIFDVILCCGLLYHLDEPVDFLAQMSSMTGPKGLIFVDTHIAPTDDKALEICHFKNVLSELVDIEYRGHTYQGRWYHEYNKDTTETGKNAWTSVSNHRSFWLTEDALIQALGHAGFNPIYKLYGGFELENEFTLRQTYSRSYYIGLKEDH